VERVISHASGGVGEASRLTDSFVGVELAVTHYSGRSAGAIGFAGQTGQFKFYSKLGRKPMQ